MATFKKNILDIGGYQSPDGTVVVTPDRLAHWADTFDLMTAANLRIPVGWDHASDPADSLPESIADPARKRSAKDTAGYLTGFAVRDDGKGASITLEIPDESDAKKVENNLAWISPVIFDSFGDGQGVEYTDCITHVDLVQHPVDASQTEFKPAATACALRMGLINGGSPQLFRMAQGDPMADDDKKKDPPTNDSSSDDSGTADSDGDSGNAMKIAKEILDGMGAVVPGDFDPLTEEGFKLFATAVMNKTADDTVDDDQTDDAGLEPTTPQIATLALEKSAVGQYALRQYKEGVAAELDGLLNSGRCTPREAKTHSAAVGAVRLSLDTQGKPRQSDVEKWIESRREVPQGTFWDDKTRTRMSRLEPTKPSIEVGGEVSSEDADAALDEHYGVEKK